MINVHTRLCIQAETPRVEANKRSATAKIERENQVEKEYKKVIASEKVKEYKNISECKTVDEIFAFAKMKGYKQGYEYFELRRKRVD